MGAAALARCFQGDPFAHGRSPARPPHPAIHAGLVPARAAAEFTSSGDAQPPRCSPSSCEISPTCSAAFRMRWRIGFGPSFARAHETSRAAGWKTASSPDFGYRRLIVGTTLSPVEHSPFGRSPYRARVRSSDHPRDLYSNLGPLRFAVWAVEAPRLCRCTGPRVAAVRLEAPPQSAPRLDRLLPPARMATPFHDCCPCQMRVADVGERLAGIFDRWPSLLRQRLGCSSRATRAVTLGVPMPFTLKVAS